MKKSIVFLIIGIAMFIFAIGFIWVAINHPTYSFSIIPLGLLYAIYLLYLLLNIACFVAFGVLKHKGK